jgi:stress response protein SCP2
MATTMMVKKGDIKKLPPGDVFTVGLGWDPAAGQGSVDLDSWVLRRHTDGTMDAIFWGNPNYQRPDLGQISPSQPYIATPEEDVVHHGDDRTGEVSAEGYDETIELVTAKAPTDVDQYSVFVTLYEDPPQGNTLGIATNVKCGVKAEVCTIDRRADGGWEMNAKQQGYDDSMFDVAKKLGCVGFP